MLSTWGAVLFGACLFGACLFGALGWSVFQAGRVAWRLEITDEGVAATNLVRRRHQLPWSQVGRVSLKDMPTWQGGVRIIEVASVAEAIRIRVASDLPGFVSVVKAIESRSSTVVAK